MGCAISKPTCAPILFAHLQQLSFSYYNNTKIGQIMARITSDLFEITEFAHHGPEKFFIRGHQGADFLRHPVRA